MKSLLALLLLLLTTATTTSSNAASAKHLRRLNDPRSLQTDDGGGSGPGDAGTEDDEDTSGASEPGMGIDLEAILGFGCFPDDATVQVEHKPSPVLMKDLQVGDRVWTKENVYAPVYAFGHRDEEQTDVFVQLETRLGTVLQLTGEHLVYLHGKGHPVRADSIQPGQVLQQLDSSGTTVPAEVVDTLLVTRKGVYAPFTTTGSIVVNGIAASSYISLQPLAVEKIQFSNGEAFLLSQHQFIHWGLSPLRMACLGISKSFCDHNNNEQGMPTYISSVLSLQETVEQQHWTVQCILMFVYLFVAGSFMILEQMVGASEAPSAVAVVGLLYFFAAKMLRLEVRVKMIAPRRRRT